MHITKSPKMLTLRNPRQLKVYVLCQFRMKPALCGQKEPEARLRHYVVASFAQGRSACDQADSSSSVRAVRGRSTKTYSVLLSDAEDSDCAPAIALGARGSTRGFWRTANGLLASPDGALSAFDEGVWRWLALRLGGDDFAFFSRSSVSRRRASSASSSWVCVVTACFLLRGLSAELEMAL
jgi:hypothetical protein